MGLGGCKVVFFPLLAAAAGDSRGRQDAGVLHRPVGGHPRGLLPHDEAQRHDQDRKGGGEDDREGGRAPHVVPQADG